MSASSRFAVASWLAELLAWLGSLPIRVPPGVAGMEPKLSISLVTGEVAVAFSAREPHCKVFR
jgi:hypothetical protein